MPCATELVSKNYVDSSSGPPSSIRRQSSPVIQSFLKDIILLEHARCSGSVSDKTLYSIGGGSDANANTVIDVE